MGGMKLTRSMDGEPELGGMQFPRIWQTNTVGRLAIANPFLEMIWAWRWRMK